VSGGFREETRAASGTREKASRTTAGLEEGSRSSPGISVVSTADVPFRVVNESLREFFRSVINAIEENNAPHFG
jgi:hypothetical protein